MHMADALLSPSVGAAFWAGTLGAIAYSSRRLKESLDEHLVPLMGVLGAFIFAAQMINFAIPGTGSSGHLGGGLLLAVILGPHAAFLVMASVLTVQALFFADGGLLALGCNIWNLGIYPCFVAYPFIYKPLTSSGLQGSRRRFWAALVAAVAALQLGALSVVTETFLSGRGDLPFRPFLLLMQPIHLAIGIVEGVATAGVLASIGHVRPDLLRELQTPEPSGAKPLLKQMIVAGALLAVLTGGLLSLFSSDLPDGLEWAVQRLNNSQEPDRTGSSALRKIQEKTALMPDYTFRDRGGTGNSEASAPEEPKSGRAVSGLLGAGIVLALVVGINGVVRFLRRRRQ